MLKAVGEEKLRRGEHAITLAEAEFAKRRADAEHAVMAMHDAFWSARSAGRIEHQRGRIGRDVYGIRRRGGADCSTPFIRGHEPNICGQSAPFVGEDILD